MADDFVPPEAFLAEYAAKLKIVQSGVGRFAGFVLPKEFAPTLDPYLHEGLIAFNQLLEGPGKRGRGVLAVAGYELARELYGGEHAPSDETLIGNVAGILEGVQAMLLAIDDMADNSDRRRNLPTAHAQLRDSMNQRNESGNVTERARDYTVLNCFMIDSVIQTSLLQLSVPAELKLTAAVMLNDTLIKTARGQGWDMTPLAPSERITVQQTVQIAQDKTSHYTIESPWRLGALFGGMPQDKQDGIATYATKLGRAFQIHDDILGTFGDPEVTGKSAQSDFIERKRTILVALVHERAVEQDLHALDVAFEAGQFADYQAVLQRSGALDAARTMVAELTQEAVDSLPEEWPEKHVAFLRNLALTNVHRKK